MTAPSETSGSLPNRFVRGDWVASALEVVLLLVILGFGLTALSEGLSAFLDDSITATVRLDEEEIGEVTSAVHTVQPDRATLTVDDPTVAERAAVAAPPVLEGLVVGAVATLVLEVVRSLRAGDPFTATNARLLAQAAVVAVVGGVVVTAASVAGPIVIEQGVPDDLPVRLSIEASSTSMYAGLLLAAVAQVFRRGCQLRDELDGVV